MKSLFSIHRLSIASESLYDGQRWLIYSPANVLGSLKRCLEVSFRTPHTVFPLKDQAGGRRTESKICGTLRPMAKHWRGEIASPLLDAERRIRYKTLFVRVERSSPEDRSLRCGLWSLQRATFPLLFQLLSQTFCSVSLG
jgi:hypothetical protein